MDFKCLMCALMKAVKLSHACCHMAYTAMEMLNNFLKFIVYKMYVPSVMMQQLPNARNFTALITLL